MPVIASAPAGCCGWSLTGRRPRRCSPRRASPWRKLTKQDANTDTFTQALLGHFAQIVRPRHDWTAIFLLLSLHVLLIGPIALVAAKMKVDFRLLTLAYLLAIAGFSAAIWRLGKRGYGEEDQLNSIGYAAALGNGAFAVTGLEQPLRHRKRDV